MAKYIDADHLIEKILQLQKEYAQTEVKEDNKAMRAVLGGQCFTLMEVVKIIQSLQDEQPEVDLEKEIEEHSERMPMSEFTIDSEAEEFVKWAKQEFRHFYELGLKSRK